MLKMKYSQIVANVLLIALSFASIADSTNLDHGAKIPTEKAESITEANAHINNSEIEDFTALLNSVEYDSDGEIYELQYGPLDDDEDSGHHGGGGHGGEDDEELEECDDQPMIYFHHNDSIRDHKKCRPHIEHMERFPVWTMNFGRVAWPFIIMFWILLANIGKMGKYYFVS